MNEELSIQVKVDNEKIVIEFPVDLLIAQQENREDMPLRIVDKTRMIDWISRNLISFGKDKDTDLSVFDYLIADLFDDAFDEAYYSQGEAWLCGSIPEENDDELESE